MMNEIVDTPGSFISREEIAELVDMWYKKRGEKVKKKEDNNMYTKTDRAAFNCIIGDLEGFPRGRFCESARREVLWYLAHYKYMSGPDDTCPFLLGQVV